MLDLAELELAPEELGDVSLEDPTEYQDQTDPAPPPEANYVFRALDADFDRDPDTREVRYDIVNERKFPIILVPQVEIVEPEEIDGTRVGGRKVMLYQRFRTRPSNRLGASVNEFTDLLRSFDSTVSFSSVEEGLSLLNGFIGNGATFRGRGRWRAYDTEYANAEFAKVGGREGASAEDVKRINKIARIVGAKRFPLAKDGRTRLGHIQGPSGATLTARFEIGRLYPSHELNVKIGK